MFTGSGGAILVSWWSIATTSVGLRRIGAAAISSLPVVKVVLSMIVSGLWVEFVLTGDEVNGRVDSQRLRLC